MTGNTLRALVRTIQLDIILIEGSTDNDLVAEMFKVYTIDFVLNTSEKKDRNGIS